MVVAAAVAEAGTGPVQSAGPVAAAELAHAVLAVVGVPSEPAGFFSSSSRYYERAAAGETSASRRRCIH